MKIAADGLEKERDFYFGKLRAIEILCQDHEDDTVVKEIMEILYATEVKHVPFYNKSKFMFSQFSVLISHFQAMD